jgi:hypothetical protein
MLSQKLVDKAIEQGIIKLPEHDRLLIQATNITKRSRVPEQALLMSIKDHFSEKEVKLLAKLKKMQVEGQYSGIIFTGTDNILPKFQALCGALLRNFIDGVVLTTSEILKDRDLAETCGILLIPDLYREILGAGQASWKADNLKLVSVIDNRRLKGMLTIIHVDNLQGATAVFGETFIQMLTESYVIL